MGLGNGGNQSALRAIVAVPLPPRNAGDATSETPRRDAASRLEEAVGLAEAINLDVVDGMIIPLTSYRPATLMGSGKVAEIAGRVAADEVGLVVVDHTLTPVQQRNLEKEWKTKVIDRTGLILEIFGERAHTREGRLQVELAHLNYQKSRLVRSWTHLERQRGGFGFLGGPGETQIEADRRLIQERIKRIEKELEGVVRMRRLQRENRRRVPHPIVALVGYTNAGKSTLFNTLTRSEQFAEDLLFATLDPTLRKMRLPHGTEVILSDTVGFISDLPTHLVAAFRATLEEVIEASVILHVRDIAHPDTAIQARDVETVLAQLGVDAREPNRVIEVWNKIDLLAPGQRPSPGRIASEKATIVALSALTGEGLPALRSTIEEILNAAWQSYRLTLPAGEGALLANLYRIAEVVERNDEEGEAIRLSVRLPAARRSQFLESYQRFLN
ncbi:MAG: GTPase HflX [Bauldia sp.]|nr:GTPase HflX [Bauldia sp.]